MSRSKPAAKSQKPKTKPKAPPDASPARPKAELKIESLESRILLSATWSGTAGADSYAGTNADNEAYGLGGNDSMSGGNGDDSLYGGDGSDMLFGGNHDDILHGGAGDDQLFGDNQDDVLISGGGNDVMSGGHHNDTFQFDGAQHGDVITVDGGMHNDTLDLSDYSNDQIEDDGSTLVVHMSESTHFTVNYTSIENITTADGSFAPGSIPGGYEPPAEEPPPVQDEADQPGADDGEQPPVEDVVTPPAEEPPPVQDEADQPGADDGEQPPVEDVVTPPAEEPPPVQDEADQPGADDGEQPPVEDVVTPTAEEPPLVQDEADQPGADDGEQPPAEDVVPPPAEESPPVQDLLEQLVVDDANGQVVESEAQLPMPDDPVDDQLDDAFVPVDDVTNAQDQDESDFPPAGGNGSLDQHGGGHSDGQNGTGSNGAPPLTGSSVNPGAGGSNPSNHASDQGSHDWTGGEDLQVMDPASDVGQFTYDDDVLVSANQTPNVEGQSAEGTDDSPVDPFLARAPESATGQLDSHPAMTEFNSERVVMLPEFDAVTLPADLLLQFAGPNAEAAFDRVDTLDLESGFPMSMSQAPPQLSVDDEGAAGSRAATGAALDGGWIDADARRRSANDQVDAIDAAVATDQRTSAAQSGAGYVVGPALGIGETTGFFARLWSAVRGLGATSRHEEDRESNSRSGSR